MGDEVIESNRGLTEETWPCGSNLVLAKEHHCTVDERVKLCTLY